MRKHQRNGRHTGARKTAPKKRNSATSLASPAMEPVSPNYFDSAPRSKWGGLIGRVSVAILAMTLIGQIDSLITLAAWAHWLVNWWSFFVHQFWTFVASLANISLLPDDSLFLTTSLLFISIAVGARIAIGKPIFEMPKNLLLARLALLSAVIPVIFIYGIAPLRKISTEGAPVWSTALPLGYHQAILVVSVLLGKFIVIGTEWQTLKFQKRIWNYCMRLWEVLALVAIIIGLSEISKYGWDSKPPKW